ncbi:hypothetical protein OWV82_021618 [Melia azedarach]|uniref:Uncharacterized protein n=1 Tax=Melia azedarach TaxID=155640 RepID=A0ACC1WZX8_MELAZ|nr:hypothetical protein OWV82_021618 [Melia azedarach]
MAASLQKSQPSYHTRSNSFPTRSHPFTSEVDQQLSRLRSSQAASISSSSSIGNDVNGLQDLHSCVDKMLQLPLIQQALAQGHQKKSIDELLNGSLRILDICSTAQNALLQTKESTQELQSVLRRRRGDETGLTSEIKKYLASRKTIKRAIQKALGNLKGTEDKCSSQINEKYKKKVIINALKEVEAVTSTLFESLLSPFSGPKTPSKLNGLPSASKLMRPKRIACEKEETGINELEKVDAELSTLISHKTSKAIDIFHLQNQLKELESNIQDLEEGLESLSRQLIKARVSLLNILNN